MDIGNFIIATVTIYYAAISPSIGDPLAAHQHPRQHPLVTKIFPVTRATLGNLILPDGTSMVRRFFENEGMQFPPGAFVRWEPKRERLVVRDTKEDLELVPLLIYPSAPK